MSGVKTRRKAWDALASDQIWFSISLERGEPNIMSREYFSFQYSDGEGIFLLSGFLRDELPQLIIDCAEEVVIDNIWFYSKFKKGEIEEAVWERERQMYFRWLGENMENYLVSMLHDIQLDLESNIDYHLGKLKEKMLANLVFGLKELLSLFLGLGIGALIAKWGKVAVRGGGKVIKPIATKVAARYIPKPTPDNIKSITSGVKGALDRAGKYLAVRTKGGVKVTTSKLTKLVDDLEKVLLNCVNNPNLDKVAAKASIKNGVIPILQEYMNSGDIGRLLGEEMTKNVQEGMAQLFAENIAKWFFSEIIGDTIQTLDVIGWDWLKNKLGIKEEEFVICRDGLNLILPGMGDETFVVGINGRNRGLDINFDDLLGYIPVLSTYQSVGNCFVSFQVIMLFLASAASLWGKKDKRSWKRIFEHIINELRTITNNDKIESMLLEFANYPSVNSPFKIRGDEFVFER